MTLARLSPADLVAIHAGEALRFARGMARRIPRHVSRDELDAAALQGLASAARDYDPGPDPASARRFGPYMHWRIRGSIRDYLRELDFFPGRRRAGAPMTRSSLDDPAGDEGEPRGWSIPAGDSEGAAACDAAERLEDARERILAILEYLPDHHVGTLLDWLECPSGADCARRLGLSEATISLRRRNALDAAKRASARRGTDR